MEWIHVLTIAGAVIGSCWIMHRENMEMHRDNSIEMKDFHGRLCALEERYLQMMQRILEERNK